MTLNELTNSWNLICWIIIMVSVLWGEGGEGCIVCHMIILTWLTLVTLIRGLWVFITTYCIFFINKSVQFVLVIFRFLLVIIFLRLHSGSIYDDIIIICYHILTCLSQVPKSTKKGIMRSKTKIEYIYTHIHAIYCIIIKPIFIVSTLYRWIYPLDTHIFV